MKKDEYITKHGEAAWDEHLAYHRNYYKKNKEQHKECAKKWEIEHKEQRNKQHAERHRIWRTKGSTRFCRVNFDLIENYELAKADNFDKKKWHLHHRLENYYSSETLMRKGLYNNVNPEALIWLPANEHKFDLGISNYHPELSKWHQRRFERE